jgi:putative Holliday junction resolvase
VPDRIAGLYSALMKHLGVDYGSHRIGLAISDSNGRLAFPLTTVGAGEGRRSAVAAVKAYVEKEAIERIVVGMPLSLDGSRGPAARRADHFARDLRRAVSAPVDVWDERFTTQQAERTLLEANVSRQRRRQVVDQMAAALILQSFLDAHGGAENGDESSA